MPTSRRPSDTRSPNGRRRDEPGSPPRGQTCTRHRCGARTGEVGTSALRPRGSDRADRHRRGGAGGGCRGGARVGGDGGVGGSRHQIDGRGSTDRRDSAAELGGLDTLYNNAGVYAPADTLVDQLDEATWDDILSINLGSVYRFCHCCLPYLLREESPVIVNVSSVAGYAGDDRTSAYPASKGAISRSQSRSLTNTGGMVFEPKRDLSGPDRYADGFRPHCRRRTSPADSREHRSWPARPAGGSGGRCSISRV